MHLHLFFFISTTPVSIASLNFGQSYFGKIGVQMDFALFCWCNIWSTFDKSVLRRLDTLAVRMLLRILFWIFLNFQSSQIETYYIVLGRKFDAR